MMTLVRDHALGVETYDFWVIAETWELIETSGQLLLPLLVKRVKFGCFLLQAETQRNRKKNLLDRL